MGVFKSGLTSAYFIPVGTTLLDNDAFVVVAMCCSIAVMLFYRKVLVIGSNSHVESVIFSAGATMTSCRDLGGLYFGTDTP